MTQFQSQSLNAYLANTLRPNEKVLWRYEGAGATAWYMFMSLYGLPFITVWCGVVGFIARPILSSGNAVAMALVVPFLLGFVMWFFYLWLLLRCRSFAYAITNQRVFIMNSFAPVGGRVFGPDQLQSMVRLGTPDKGTLRLSPPGKLTFNSLSGDYYMNMLYPAKLVNIPNPAKIESLIYDTIASKLTTIPVEPPKPYKANPNRKPNLFHGD